MMTELQFRANPLLVQDFQEILESQTMKEVLSIMEQNNPRLRSIPSDITDTVANIHLGRINGYSEYHELLLSLATMPKISVSIKETYAPETQE